jgi:DegV family protein with EDD domain
MGLGFLVLAAARAAAAGKTVDEVVAAAERMREEIQLLFVVDSLEYLHRGGRIGGAKRLFGTALSVKPILHFDNGSIEFLSQARTKRKALEQMLEIIEARLVGKLSVHMSARERSGSLFTLRSDELLLGSGLHPLT